MRRYFEHSDYKKVKESPQSLRSIVQPNQAPSLRYILGVIQSGGNLNVKMAMEYDNSPAIDDVTIRDIRHVTPDDLNKILERHYPTPPDSVDTPPGGATTVDAL